ncbi:MAG: glutathione S-transferase family protein [Rhodoplanes sp.]
MKLYDNRVAPNPRRVRIFLAEKGMSVPTEEVDLGALAHQTEAYTAINPFQRVPALVLDDGTVLTESIAICRYIEWLRPDPVLFGRSGIEAALIEMWERRVEHYLFAPVTHVFRHLHPGMKSLEVPQVPAWGEANKARVLAALKLLDRELAAKPFVAGAAFSVADITALVAVDWMRPARLTVPDGRANLRRWHREVSARPSATA